LAAAAALFALAFTCSTAMAATGHRGAVITIKLPDVDRIELQRDTGGGLVYLVTYDDDHNEALSPEAFASLVSEKLNRQSWLEKICNISSPIGFIWVSVGLLGQVLFTGRLFVQWLASEREKRSVVPLAFWWMSLIGGALLLVYFIWRRDVVGFLGQLTGFTIYSRNLILIYARRREHAHAAAAGTSNAR
jgi:lipid-A-disaccharide synthase-like uncharacterized protein